MSVDHDAILFLGLQSYEVDLEKIGITQSIIDTVPDIYERLHEYEPELCNHLLNGYDTDDGMLIGYIIKTAFECYPETMNPVDLTGELHTLSALFESRFGIRPKLWLFDFAS